MNFIRDFANAALIALAFIPFHGWARSYSAEAIEGLVVDAETRQPLEGAIVVAYWGLEYGMEGGNMKIFQLMESVTDKQGRFRFPPWGPKEIPAQLPSDARLKNRDPALDFYLDGYEVKAASNSKSVKDMGGHGDSVRKSEWNGKTVALKKFSGDRARYAEYLRLLRGSPVYLYPPAMIECVWNRVPVLITTIMKQHSLSVIGGTDKRIISPYPPGMNPCGSPGDFYKEHLK
jgi:hypothetical protein